MKVFHIIGQPGSGKTTLVADLVKELCRQNLSVGTIKHSAHSYELDKPGKDSFLHRAAGAVPAAMMNREMAAVYFPRSPDMTPATLLEQTYAHLGLDIVLIEGWISGPFPKIEVWRECVKRPLLFPGACGVKAVVTDDSLDTETRRHAEVKQIQCLKRSALPAIVSLMTGDEGSTPL